MQYSIIIASKENTSTIQQCVDAIARQLPPKDSEIIVVQTNAVAVTTADTVALKIIEASSSLLVPQLWQQGLQQAQGDWVGFTIAECIASDNWLRELEMQMENHAAMGGAIAPPPEDAKRMTWALYFLRYSNFIPQRTSQVVDDIAGDNAIYRRSSLDTCSDVTVNGFWETLVHDCIQAQQHTIYFQASATMQLIDADSFSTIFQERFLHGRHYGSTRPDNTRLKRFLRVFPFAPAIYLVLLVRIILRTRSLPSPYRSKLWYAMPATLAILFAWTLGEISGYMMPSTRYS